MELHDLTEHFASVARNAAHRGAACKPSVQPGALHRFPRQAASTKCPRKRKSLRRAPVCTPGNRSEGGYFSPALGKKSWRGDAPEKSPLSWKPIPAISSVAISAKGTKFQEPDAAAADRRGPNCACCLARSLKLSFRRTAGNFLVDPGFALFLNGVQRGKASSAARSNPHGASWRGIPKPRRDPSHEKSSLRGARRAYDWWLKWRRNSGLSTSEIHQQELQDRRCFQNAGLQ